MLLLDLAWEVLEVYFENPDMEVPMVHQNGQGRLPKQQTWRVGMLR
jgi:hypothetical protein